VQEGYQSRKADAEGVGQGRGIAKEQSPGPEKCSVGAGHAGCEPPRKCDRQGR